MVRGVIPLDEHVCFALYTASRTVINRYRPLLEAIGLTYPQYLALLVLWADGDTTVKDLGAALGLDSSTLSPLLKRLESAGLVTRARSAADERSVRVSLTADGHALQVRAEPIAAQVACHFGLSVDELVQLRTTLRNVTDAVNRVGAAAHQGALQGGRDGDSVHG